jgi:hypothetical protein
MQEVIDYVPAMDGVLLLAPQPGDGTPEIAWGDVFFYYAPDGVVPSTQPFGTVVTKDYPDDGAAQLDRDGVFRVNVAAGAEWFGRLTEQEGVASAIPPVDPSTFDVVQPHPVYGSLHWLCVVNPGPNTTALLKELLTAAHGRARDRFERRAALRSS